MTTVKQPNFILITTDQQQANHLGCYGNSELCTPHIDGLANRGRRFERFYVASGVCMANRASLMTGRFPSVHGVRCNGIPLSEKAVTFVDLLRDAGYRTALAGKCHLQNMTDIAPELMVKKANDHLEEPREDSQQAVRPRNDEGNYDNESKSKWREDPNHNVNLPYYGFDHVNLCSFHGDLVEGEYYRWLSTQVEEPDAIRGEDNAIPDNRFKLTQAYRTKVPEQLYPTTWIADRAIDQLVSAEQDDKPFFLHCSFTDPHHPFTPPGKYWDMYDPKKISLPLSFQNSPASHFSPVAALQLERQEKRAKIDSTVAYSATENEIREAIALTYGMISMIDDSVGRILAKLDELRMAENTVVIFTSDHGDFMGDHGLLLKSALHYSSLIRVPFIWAEHGLQQQGAETDGLWSTMDIGVSILERAGLAPSYGCQGRSFAAALQNPSAEGRQRLLIEEDGHAATFGLDIPVRARTAITQQHRLTVYDQEEWGELYDLWDDKVEVCNLFNVDSKREVRSQMFETLARAMLDADDRLPLPSKRA